MDDVLIICAHPDDEVLGCGATSASLASQGVRVSVLIATDGEGGRLAGAGQIASRREAAFEAARTMGVAPPLWLDFPDQKLDTLPRIELVRAIEVKLAQSQPKVVFTHDPSDLNLDHRIIFDAVATALRPTPGRVCRALLTFETPSATDYGGILLGTPFMPNIFVDASAGFETKLAAFKCYANEVRPAPHPRSLEHIETLARFRGASVGAKFAEAFRLVYGIVDPEHAASAIFPLTFSKPG